MFIFSTEAAMYIVTVVGVAVLAVAIVVDVVVAVVTEMKARFFEGVVVSCTCCVWVRCTLYLLRMPDRILREENLLYDYTSFRALFPMSPLTSERVQKYQHRHCFRPRRQMVFSTTTSSISPGSCSVQNFESSDRRQILFDSKPEPLVGVHSWWWRTSDAAPTRVIILTPEPFTLLLLYRVLHCTSSTTVLQYDKTETKLVWETCYWFVGSAIFVPPNRCQQK